MAKRNRAGAFVRGGVQSGMISRELKKRGEKAVQMAAAEVVRQAEIIRDDAKSRVPVRTGALRDSIEVVQYDSGLYCRIKADAKNKQGIPYGQFVEFDPRIANPFMYPAFDAHKDDARDAIAEAVRRGFVGG